MRIALVGTRESRDRLRAALDDSFDVVAEFSTMAEAKAADVNVDALMVAPAHAAADDATSERLAEPLTARELDVLEHLAAGLSNKAIGDRLGISDQTVKFHVASITGKLGVTNRTEAVRRALRLGLIAL